MNRFRLTVLSLGLLAAVVLLAMAGQTLLAASLVQPPGPAADLASAGPQLADYPLDVALQANPTATATATDTTATPIPTLVMPATSSDTIETIDWTAPANLSRSGATTDPQIVVDSNGRFHALWRDAIDGFAYAIGDGFAWSDSVIVETPFSTRRYFPDLRPDSGTPRFTPTLVADTRGNIHAFWIDDSGTDAPVLYHSQVPAGQFNNIDAWSARQSLDTGAVAPAATAAENGQVHVAYVRNQESGGQRAGIYHQVLRNNNAWSGPVALYTSRYLRAVAAEAANVQIHSGDNGVAVAWDDAGREQVFVTLSPDGGQTWIEPVEIDRRAAEDGREARGPGGITVGLLPGTAVVTWGAGHEQGRDCTQYFRRFSAADSTWSPAQSMEDLPSCLDTAQFLRYGNTLYLLGTVGDAADRQQTLPAVTTYLLAWDGTRWGATEVQSALTGFLNSDTNQPLALGCQDGLIRDSRLYLVACDRGTGRDSWSTSRALGDPATWFPPPAVWQGPDRVAGSAATPAGLQLVADATGATHAFWLDDGAAILHMRWDGQVWSAALPVVSPLQGPIEEFSAATFADRIYLVGRDQQGLFFSQTRTDNPTEWSVPAPIEATPGTAIAPRLLADNSGLLLAYAVALNEERGIYITRSSDLGQTWSEPRLAFDGTAAGWDMVDQPQLTKTDGGELHLVWLRRSLPPDAAPLALAYSRSADGGFTWSDAAELVNTPVVWSALFGQGERVLHHLWAEVSNGRHIVWHAVSIDDGLNWGEATQVTALELGEIPAATIDPAGRLHLLAHTGGRLLNWVWDGVSWQSDESLRTPLADGGVMGAAADVAGRLVTLYAAPLPNVTAAAGAHDLYAMWRPLAVPAEALPTPPPPPPTATPGVTPTATVQPSPTPTVVIPTGADSTNLLSQIPGAGSRYGQLAIAIVPAALVVLLVSIIGVRAMRKGRR